MLEGRAGVAVKKGRRFEILYVEAEMMKRCLTVVRHL